MNRYKDIIYMVLDEIKSISGEQTITEQHVIFLMHKYRNYLLTQQIAKGGDGGITLSTYQTICLDLTEVNGVSVLTGLSDGGCTGTYMKSKSQIPNVLAGTNPSLRIANAFATNVKMVSPARFRYVGYNKFMRGIIYGTLNDDRYLYIKVTNPQISHLQSVKITAVFEDPEEAEELTCNQLGHQCDIYEREFPLQDDLIPPLIDAIVKELYQALIRPEDKDNNAKDDIADIATFLRSNAKSDLAKQIGVS